MTDDRTLQEVLELYGLTPDSADACQLLSSGSGNRVYAVSTTAGKVVLRQSHPSRTRQWLELEAAVLEHLARVDFPAVRQRPTLGRPTLHRPPRDASGPPSSTSTQASLSQPDDAQLATLARLQARLHGVLARLPGRRALGFVGSPAAPPKDLGLHRPPGRYPRLPGPESPSNNA